MRRRRYTPEQIIRKLREADRLLAEGKTVDEVARHLEIDRAERAVAADFQFFDHTDDARPRGPSTAGTGSTDMCGFVALCPPMSRRGDATRGNRYCLVCQTPCRYGLVPRRLVGDIASSAQFPLSVSMVPTTGVIWSTFVHSLSLPTRTSSPGCNRTAR